MVYGFDEILSQHEDLFEEFILRKRTEIPDTFMPSAEGVAVASWRLMYSVHPMALYDAGRQPYRWVGGVRTGLFRRFADKTSPGESLYLLSVRRYGKLWSIEREALGENIHEVLAFNFGPVPVFHPKHKTAIALAKYCHPNPREEAKCLRWVPVTA